MLTGGQPYGQAALFPDEDALRDLWLRILTLWYRLTGSTPTQADWRARQATQAPKRASSAARVHLERAKDARFTCVCGALVVRGDRTCSTCGRRQIIPFALRRLARTLGVSDESPGVPGTIFALLTMVVGYLVQVRYGPGDFFDPTVNNIELLELGGSYASFTLGPQPWRAVTYTMLHGGIMHIAFNAMALYTVGPLVERRFGSSRFLLGWLVGAIAGALGAAWFTPQAPLLGASGAVSGLIGMAMLQGHREQTSGGRALRNTMIRWMVLTTIFGAMMGGVSHSAHFGGLAGGALVGLALPPADRNPRRRRLTAGIGLVAIAAYVFTFYGFARWFFYRDIPQSASLPVQADLYRLTVFSHGEAVAFGTEAEALLREVRTTRLLNGRQAAALRGRGEALTQGWPVAQAGVFLHAMEVALAGALVASHPMPEDSELAP